MDGSELYAWQFDGPSLYGSAGNKPKGKRDAGALEEVDQKYRAQDGQAGREIGIEVHSVKHRGIIGYRDQVDINGFSWRKLQDVLAGAQLEGLQAGQTLLPVVGHQRPAP